MIIKCYDPEGKEFQKETVDARECVAILGWTLTPPEKPLQAETLVAAPTVAQAAETPPSPAPGDGATAPNTAWPGAEPKA